jgi:hypothetical protein
MEVKVKRKTTWPVLGILVVLALGSLNGGPLSARSNPLAQGDSASPERAIGLAEITPTPQPSGEPGSTRDNPLLNPCTGQPFTTIMTGVGLQNVEAQVGGVNNNQYVISFSLADNDEARRFSQHTATRIGQALAIVLDGQVLSAPVIQAALTTGGIMATSPQPRTRTKLRQRAPVARRQIIGTDHGWLDDLCWRQRQAPGMPTR